MSEPLILVLGKIKETRGTVVYTDGDVISGLYIPKRVLAAPYPPQIKLTIEEVKNG